MRIPLIIVIIAVVFGYPPFAEGTDGPCAAVVARFLSVPSRSGGAADGTGAAAYKAVAEHYPMVPPQLSCTYLFWKAMIDPTSAMEVLRDVRATPPAAAAAPPAAASSPSSP